MPTSYYNSGYGITGGGRSPYAGPSRNMEGDPAFEAWRQRQFSSASFSGPDDPLFKMPTQRSDAGGSPFDRLKNEADPRKIMEGDAFKRLLELSRSTQGSDASKRALDPAIAELMKYLGQTDPLGIAGLGDLVRQKGTSSLRDAGSSARRRTEESFGGAGGAADPSALAFMKDLMRVQEAGGMGEVNRAGAETSIATSQATAEFRRGLTEALASIGIGEGNLALGEMNAQTGAAGTAGTLESYARNNWADVFGRLLGDQMRGSGESRPVRGYDNRGRPVYDDNPFPGPQSFGQSMQDRNFWAGTEMPRATRPTRSGFTPARGNPVKNDAYGNPVKNDAYGNPVWFDEREG
jgi:hypothetical protein